MWLHAIRRATDRMGDDAALDEQAHRLANVVLLVLDDWRLQGFSTEGRRDLLEIAEARHGRKSILIASQIPVKPWPEVIGEPTIADAVLDRIVHNACRIDLKGEPAGPTATHAVAAAPTTVDMYTAASFAGTDGKISA